jgi:hypothetical protein
MRDGGQLNQHGFTVRCLKVVDIKYVNESPQAVCTGFLPSWHGMILRRLYRRMMAYAGSARQGMLWRVLTDVASACRRVFVRRIQRFATRGDSSNAGTSPGICWVRAVLELQDSL